MGRRILMLMGFLILAAGLGLAAIGGHKILTNLPMSEERVVEEARRVLIGQQQTSENPPDPSAGESVELQIWKSALEMMSEVLPKIDDKIIVDPELRNLIPLLQLERKGGQQ